MSQQVAKLSDIVPLSGVNIIIGASGTGKSYFTKQILLKLDPSLKVNIYARDHRDWEDLETYFSDYTYSESNPIVEQTIGTIQPGSIVVIDDFIPTSKEKTYFQKSVNYFVRHNNLTVFLITHNIVKNIFYNYIISHTSLFISSCHSNIYLAKQLDRSYSLNVQTLLENNLNNNLDFIFIYVYKLTYIFDNILSIFNPEKIVKMYVKNYSFYIVNTENYSLNESEVTDTGDNEACNSLQSLITYISQLFPKFKSKLTFLTRDLYSFFLDKESINTSNLHIKLNNKDIMHIVDFITLCQNPFKKNFNNNELIVLKFLKKQKFKSPLINIRNKYVREYLK